MDKYPAHKKANLIPAATSAEVISGNEDLLTEILLHLPPKSLIRFSAVSKQWLLFISSPQFCRRHSCTKKFSPTGLFFCDHFTYDSEAFSVSLSDDATPLPPVSFIGRVDTGLKVRLLQSCNGYLLLAVVQANREDDLKLPVVYNPTTRQSEVLLGPECDEDETFVGFNLIYDPFNSPYYRVVCIKKRSSFMGHRVSIYFSETNEWKKSGNFQPTINIRFDRGVFWNGAIIWMGKTSLYFDGKSEEIIWKTMPPKPHGFSSEKLRYFGEWRGHLHLVLIKRQSAMKFNVLELDKDSFKWFIKYRVDLAPIVSAFPEIQQIWQKEIVWGLYELVTFYVFSILAVVREEKEEDSALVIAIPGKVISYNFVSKTVKFLRDVTGEASNIDFLRAYQYIESLAPC